MKYRKILFCIFYFSLFTISYSQDFSVTTPKLDFDGNQLKISYDIVNSSASDKFFVWVEIEKKNGQKVEARTLAGDIGEKINSGSDKSIFWIPSKDSIFLNEEILVEVMAEKYARNFNKGSVILSSALMPGLGQSKVKGKPYWLMGVASYGAIAGGIIMRGSANKEYDRYLKDENPVTRNKSFDKAQKGINTSAALIVSGAAMWAANLIWVAALPNEYQPLKNGKFALEINPVNNLPLVAFRLNF